MDEEGVFMMMSKSSASSAGGGPKCGRWNPTPEQVKVLTDLFRSGLRTPTTDQIQKISSHLSSFGKIESKNVFYWFQNHKARERHHSKKRRRQSPASTKSSSPSPDRDAVTGTSGEAAAATRSMACGIGGEEREIETLELFPLSSYNEPLRIARNNHKDTAAFVYAGKDFLLDLRLSSL